jgi:hypothetical protein
MKVWKIRVRFKLEGTTEWGFETALVLSTDDMTSAGQAACDKLVNTLVDIAIDPGMSHVKIGDMSIPMPEGKPIQRRISEVEAIGAELVSEVNFIDTKALHEAGVFQVVSDEQSVDGGTGAGQQDAGRAGEGVGDPA